MPLQITPPPTRCSYYPKCNLPPKYKYIADDYYVCCKHMKELEADAPRPIDEDYDYNDTIRILI